MKTLFLFWHGLGDCILATPAIKKYKQTTGNFVGWMMMEKIHSARIFDGYPYIDQIHTCSDAWHCAGRENIGAGSKVVIQEANEVKRKFGYDEVIVLNHWSDRTKHKIFRTADEMGVSLRRSEVHPEYSYDEDSLAEWYEKIDIPEEYIFFSGKTSEKSKDWPLHHVRNIIRSKDIDLPIISPDFSWDVKKVPIAFAADVMKKAKYRYLVDSAMYHIAHALDLNVDLAYFKRGEKTWNIVHPLHSNMETVIYDLG